MIDFVQLSPPQDHVIELMPPSRTRVHPCDFGAHGDSEIRVCKTEMEGRAQLKQTLTIFVQVPHSMRTKCTGPGGIISTNTGIEVTCKCKTVAPPDQSDRPAQLIVECIFILRGGSTGRRIC